MAQEEPDAKEREFRAEGGMAPRPPEELLVQAHLRKAGRRDEEKKNQILDLFFNGLPTGSLYLGLCALRESLGFYRDGLLQDSL